MEKDLLFMNPPYDGSLHLDILSSMQIQYPNADIVNLSPCRWLQDPIAEFKNGTDFKQYQNIVKNIKDFDLIDHEYARKAFDIRITVDLGIYKINNGGGFDVDTIRFKKNTKDFILKVKHCNFKHFNDLTEVDKVDGIRVLIEGIQEQTTPWIFNPKKKTYVFFDGRMKDGRWWTDASDKRNQFSKSEGDPIPLSIKMPNEQTAYNFEKYCHSTFIKFCKWCAQSDIHPPFLVYPFLEDYSHEWTDDDINKLFGITPEYFEYMKECVKNW